MLNKWTFVGGLLVCATGCASYPTPTSRLAQSTASVNVAQEAGAQQNPKANEYMTRATEELGKAKELMNDGNNEQADYMLLRADADAKLATELAKTESAEMGAQNAQAQAKAAQTAAQKTP